MFVFSAFLNATDYLDFNFFIEPEFAGDFDNLNLISEKTKNDSIRQINIFAGKILQKADSDSSVISFLDSVGCDFASPTDFLFYPVREQISFHILSANIECDSVPILKEAIIETDSMKVGIFAVYTPDFAVKNQINPKAKFGYEIFRTVEKECDNLKNKTNFIIMLSNLGKFIDEDIVKKLTVNAVVSFDYQKKNNGVFSNKRTHYYSIISKRKKFGKLRLKFENGKIRQRWTEINF